jgi:2-methylisocitrate lyase-like PEP mutase family enzyme
MVLKIHAALDARRDPDLVLIARTDALACEGLSSAIERGQAYAEAGADVVYVEAPENDATLVTLPSAIARPLAVNMLTGGRTPTHSLQEMCEFGYKLAIWPIESLLVSARIVQKLVKTLLESGRIDNMKPEMITFKEIQNLLGLPSILELRSRMEERAGHKRVS